MEKILLLSPLVLGGDYRGNQLENARRYGALTAEGEGIALSLRSENQQMLLTVCDNGPGVPSEYRERIFEPFFRLPGASERVGGVGLGLALVKSIVERHHGVVCCTAWEGFGTCFEVNMPVS